MLGNVCGGLMVDYLGYQSTFIFCGILYFVGGISVLFAHEDCKLTSGNRLKNGRKQAKFRQNWMPGLTVAAVFMLILFICNGFVRTFELAYPAMLVEIIIGGEKAAYWTGIVSAFAAVGAMLSGALFGYLADRIAPEKLIMPALLFTGLMLLLQAAAASLFAFGAGRTLMFLAGGGLNPIFPKVLSGVTPKRKRGMVFGLSSTCTGLGTIAAALCAGGVIYIFGTRGVFYTAAVLTFLLIPATQFLLKKVMNSPYYRAARK